VTLTKYQREVLAAFAAMTVASSRWEVFGDAQAAAQDDAIRALCRADDGPPLLVALPYAETRDDHGGTRFRVTLEAYAVLGLPTPQQGGAGRAKSAAARASLPTPSRN
jgi:hypothetical protein